MAVIVSSSSSEGNSLCPLAKSCKLSVIQFPHPFNVSDAEPTTPTPLGCLGGPGKCMHKIVGQPLSTTVVFLLLPQIHHVPTLSGCSALLGLSPSVRYPRPPGAWSQSHWTDQLVKDHLQQRETHLISSSASIFLFFQLL